MGGSGYDRAIEALSVMREQMIELEVPKLYDDVLRDLKKKVLSGELGGERSDMWYKVRMERLGLIHQKESAWSDITEEDARAFMLPK